MSEVPGLRRHLVGNAAAAEDADAVDAERLAKPLDVLPDLLHQLPRRRHDQRDWAVALKQRRLILQASNLLSLQSASVACKRAIYSASIQQVCREPRLAQLDSIGFAHVFGRTLHCVVHNN